MGMFDYVKCDLPLPWPEAAAFGFEWQTKSTDEPYLDKYEIRADGTLWHEAYTLRTEFDDRWVLGIRQYRDNPNWVPTNWNGEFEIHHIVQDRGWYEVRFWLRNGVVADSIPHFEPRWPQSPDSNEMSSEGDNA